MDALFANGEATVNQIAIALPEPPTVMAVRRMMHILEEKGLLNRRQVGREIVYSPKQSKQKAGRKALQHVLDTFFGGALGDALAAHFTGAEAPTEDQLARINRLIDQARKEGR